MKLKTKAQARKAFVEEVVQARAVENEIARLQKVGELRVARAGIAAEWLGYPDLDSALASITEAEIAEAEATIAASQNGAG